MYSMVMLLSIIIIISASFDTQPSTHELYNSQKKCHTSLNLSCSYDFCIAQREPEGLLCLKIKIPIFQTTFQSTIPSSLITLNWSPFCTLNIPGLSFMKNLNWKCYILTFVKLISMKLGVINGLRQFLSQNYTVALSFHLWRSHLMCGTPPTQHF